MIEYFKILLSNEVEEFLDNLDIKTRKKILYNIDKARFSLNPEIFKKLTDDIWEFRTKHQSFQYRLFAFWDNRDGKNILVIVTHGIIKKSKRIPRAEIEKAKNMRNYYFNKV